MVPYRCGSLTASYHKLPLTPTLPWVEKLLAKYVQYFSPMLYAGVYYRNLEVLRSPNFLRWVFCDSTQNRGKSRTEF